MRSSLRPGAIEFGRMDLGQKVDYGSCIGSVGGSKMYFPTIYVPSRKEEIKLPDQGEAKIRFKVTNRETTTRNGETKHSASIDVLSIETEDPKPKTGKPGAAKRLALSAIQPGMIHFADGRPRNGDGQFMANETGGADPNSMAAAYGGAVEKRRERTGLLQRLRGMLRPPTLSAGTAPTV